ncbi:enoyl-CoA hydratase [Alteromonas pelagimontana]|uniref:Enoyl-CoA hydratase n=1 Tax=Alteromonas pelagimontana TaxID=1858656 RepID=A0A6M4M8U1_9ALTE|nr:enoyl-CoA hydratase [Alteromonas pelagimontana]QJR79399.1 enoyl-CoA hydratase [Alteromonas pelagimontana]
MSKVSCKIDAGIMTLALDRADKKNALTRDMYQTLADGISNASENQEIKVVLIRGNGDCFTAGNDISDFARGDDGEHVAETVAFMNALTDCRVPVVAQVHGLAVGIGTTMLLHCDLVYCAPETKFVLPFINLGLVPEYASSYLLPRLAGHRKASEWLMLGEPFGAAEAAQFGLVSQIVDLPALENKVNSVCQTLATKPVFALTQTKSLMKNESQMIHQQINVELDVFLEAMGTEAAQEAFDAFLHKRPVDRAKFK